MNGLCISLMILFIHSTTWDGMIFEKIKTIIKPKGMLYKPIYGCPICMTPWWGTVLYLFFFRNCLSWHGWLWTVGMACGLSVLWVVCLSVRDACLEYIHSKEEERGEK